MATESTVEDVLLCLRVRHLIPDLMRVTHHMIFPAHKFASLSPTDKLRDIGVQDLSVLYVRTSILGGSPESDSDSEPKASGSTGFSHTSGKFKSSRPDVWKPTQDGSWRCAVCPDHIPCEIKRITTHEKAERHKRNLEYHDNAQKEAAPGSPELSSPPLVSGRLPPEQVLGPLARTLEQIQHNYSPSSLQNSYVDTETGVVDWALADYDTDLAEPLQAHLLAQDLAEYLRNGDIDHNSDDDSEERSQFSKSSECTGLRLAPLNLPASGIGHHHSSPSSGINGWS
ncbi:hypothetical protein B0H14DRAFT_3652401 [Mycena olivaceomarginata]|nr:hypothetical protein B0H14DRAFT_3652401 [Mycena olivaceomarginata]